MKTLVYFFIGVVLFLNNSAIAQSVSKVEDPHAKAIRLSLQAGGITLKSYPMQSKSYGPVLLKLGFVLVNNPNYQPLKGDIRVFQPYSNGDQNGFIDLYTGRQWGSDYMEDGFWPNPKYAKYHPAFQVFRWPHRK